MSSNLPLFQYQKLASNWESEIRNPNSLGLQKILEIFCPLFLDLFTFQRQFDVSF
jgi:hypothetical protein